MRGTDEPVSFQVDRLGMTASMALLYFATGSPVDIDYGELLDEHGLVSHTRRIVWDLKDHFLDLNYDNVDTWMEDQRIWMYGDD
jgi:hypothetical protein